MGERSARELPEMTDLLNAGIRRPASVAGDTAADVLVHALVPVAAAAGAA